MLTPRFHRLPRAAQCPAAGKSPWRGFSRPLLAVALAAALLNPVPAHAASKEIIELQTQVQQLLDMMQRLQSTIDSRFGVVQHLVEQSTDNVNQMTATLNAMQQKINAQADATSGKQEAISGQIQSLNDSVDELKARIAKVDKQLQDIQSQIQSVQAAQTPATQPTGAMPTGAVPASGPGQGSSPTQDMAPGNGPNFGSSGGSSGGSGGAPGMAPSAGGSSPLGAEQAPPLQDTYQSALRDYNAARYNVAAGEFSDVAHFYPNDALAGNAEFYLGEIAYREERFSDAVKAYNQVIEQYSGNPKTAAAELHKGFSLLRLNNKEAGVRELRSLIQRYPQTAEAVQARAKLNALGLRASPAR